jgi:hypothetical protein
VPNVIDQDAGRLPVFEVGRRSPKSSAALVDKDTAALAGALSSLSGRGGEAGCGARRAPLISPTRRSRWGG